MKKITVVLALLAASTAAAQQITPEQSAAMQLGQQIGLLTYENGVLRGQLAQAQARIKSLEAGASPQSPPPKPPSP